ncbi:MAG: helix-turn-helix transcriptional regulator [Firmicutes bacterium]|nr:helix-turn-helix transcriptional regulator [Bacillota bacterium]
MEFHEKLQELRKQREMTQEELAEILYVSRTAISKWESGRGMPNVESLKAISKFFGISLDDLLSSEELLILVEDDHRQKETDLRDMVFGMLDTCMALLLFLPFFGEQMDGAVHEVSLLGLSGTQTYLKVIYYVVVVGLSFLGIMTFLLKNHRKRIWILTKQKMSLYLSVLGVIVFIVGKQPYAAVMIFVFLMVKLKLLIKA